MPTCLKPSFYWLEIAALQQRNSILNNEVIIYTEQKLKRYTTIFYILGESIGQKVFTKAK